MSNATNSAAKTDQERLASAGATRDASQEEQPGRILLVPYPKIIFLYPTFGVALIAAISMSLLGGTEKDTAGIVVAEILLGVMAVNLVILAFDFPRTTSLTLFFFAVAVVMGFILLVTLKPDVLPWLSNVLKQLHPWANAQFYWVVVLTLLAIYVAVFISVRFDYWEVRPNELLHHHGMLANLERLAAPNLRIEKEINDVFEYFLLRSGRLILHASDDRRAIILDNIPFIRKKEEAITRMLGALQVELREGPR